MRKKRGPSAEPEKPSPDRAGPRVDVSDLTKLTDMEGDDAEETRRLKAMAKEALGYLRSHHWCPPVKSTWFGLGVGGVVAVFLVEFKRPLGGDRQLWVVVGDLPSAYLVTDISPTATAALKTYCGLMEDWADSVLDGHGGKDRFPVSAPPTRANARALRDRVRTLRKSVIPAFGRAGYP